MTAPAPTVRVVRVRVTPEIRTIVAVPTAGGAGGAPLTSYRHTQAVPQSVWTVVHGLGHHPTAWSLFDESGRECAQYVVQHLDVSTSRVSMDLPTAGTIQMI